jgi:hypothetical protein
MRLVDSISIFVAKLLYDLLDAVKVFACSKISNDAFQTVEFVSTLRRRRLFVLTLKLQPFSYRRACHSRPVGCSDPFRISACCQEHDLLESGFLNMVRSSVVIQTHLVAGMTRIKETARHVRLPGRAEGAGISLSWLIVEMGSKSHAIPCRRFEIRLRTGGRMRTRARTSMRRLSVDVASPVVQLPPKDQLPGLVGRARDCRG